VNKASAFINEPNAKSGLGAGRAVNSTNDDIVNMETVITILESLSKGGGQTVTVASASSGNSLTKLNRCTAVDSD
jgi:hypothetical protein